MRLLGIDYGTKRIGVAIGDTEVGVAVPFTTLGIRNQESGIMEVIEEIVKIVRSEGVELVVVGQGGRGPMEKKVREFAEKLRKFVTVEIVDEHFTTAQVERAIQGYGKARKGVDKDAAAAALILQGWLEAHTKLRT